MKKVDRRKFLKVTSIAGAGVLAAGLPLLKTRAQENTIILVTDSPDRDIRELLRFTHRLIGNNPVIQSYPIRPADQDISIIRGTQLLDPTKSGETSPDIRAFAGQMRHRNAVGNTCVTMTTQKRADDKYATFQVDGRTVERVDRSKNYSSIVIPGVQGDTEFRLSDGKLSAIRSSCRHDICVKMGELESGRIICAPNKLVATIDGERRVDSVTG